MCFIKKKKKRKKKCYCKKSGCKNVIKKITSCPKYILPVFCIIEKISTKKTTLNMSRHRCPPITPYISFSVKIQVNPAPVREIMQNNNKGKKKKNTFKEKTLL
jgi:hypothetical protein